MAIYTNLAEDASTPAAVTGTATSATLTVTSGSFSPPSSALLVALVAIGHAPGTAPSVTMSDSGSHSWTTGPTVGAGGASTWAGIFTCKLTGAAPGSMTVSADDTTALSQDMMLDLRVLNGAQASYSGQSGTNSGSSTAWNSTITPTKLGSWVYIVVTGNSEPGTPPPTAATTTITNKQMGAPSSNTLISGRQTNPTTSLTSVSLGWTGGNTSWAWAALEILPMLMPPVQNINQSVMRAATW